MTEATGVMRGEFPFKPDCLLPMHKEGNGALGNTEHQGSLSIAFLTPVTSYDSQPLALRTMTQKERKREDSPPPLSFQYV